MSTALVKEKLEKALERLENAIEVKISALESENSKLRAEIIKLKLELKKLPEQPKSFVAGDAEMPVADNAFKQKPLSAIPQDIEQVADVQLSLSKLKRLVS
ncbi:MAG: hypothetical protein K0R73_111 [Candidatus Midichloriaceae bacterium]|jgi:hypothetical protein|nr:hypothetical protein [Candidatus Midichloriaceae bacterium]